MKIANASTFVKPAARYAFGVEHADRWRSRKIEIHGRADDDIRRAPDMRRRSLFWLLGMIVGLLVLGLGSAAMVEFDPDFCETKRPIRARAGKGSGFAKSVQSFEMALVTIGGCPWGRARQRKYGVGPNEPLPEKRSGYRPGG